MKHLTLVLTTVSPPLLCRFNGPMRYAGENHFVTFSEIIIKVAEVKKEDVKWRQNMFIIIIIIIILLWEKILNLKDYRKIYMVTKTKPACISHIIN